MAFEVSAVITLSDHFLLVQAELTPRGSVDVQLQRRKIEVLRNKDVADPGNSRILPASSSGRPVTVLHIGTRNLHVDGRGHPKIQDRIHQAAGLEIGGHLGHLGETAWRRGPCTHSCRFRGLPSG